MLRKVHLKQKINIKPKTRKKKHEKLHCDTLCEGTDSTKNRV